LWMAEELGLSFTHLPYEFDDPHLKSPDFLKLNPAGAIPTIVDDDFALSESLAINLYLAKRYRHHAPEDLFAASPEQEAQFIRWSLWAHGDLEPWVQQDLLLRDLISANAEGAAQMISRSLLLLNTFLAKRPWLAGPSFTVADLNVAGVLSPSRASRLDLTEYPALVNWLERCYSRPAALRVRQRWAAQPADRS